eukprot:3125490-Rhodomonas_salina.1
MAEGCETGFGRYDKSKKKNRNRKLRTSASLFLSTVTEVLKTDARKLSSTRTMLRKQVSMVGWVSLRWVAANFRAASGRVGLPNCVSAFSSFATMVLQTAHARLFTSTPTSLIFSAVPSQRFWSSVAPETSPTVGGKQLPYLSPPEDAGFQQTTNPNSVASRVQTGELEVMAKGKSLGTNALHVVVKNLTAGTISAVIERGTFFHNEDAGLQPLICSQNVYFDLLPGEEATRQIDAFCGVSSFGCPYNSAMSMSNYVLTTPGVMASQSAVWGWLDQFSPASSLHDDSVPSAREYYDENRQEFDSFDQAYAEAEQGATREARETHEFGGGGGAFGAYGASVESQERSDTEKQDGFGSGGGWSSVQSQEKKDDDKKGSGGGGGYSSSTDSQIDPGSKSSDTEGGGGGWFGSWDDGGDGGGDGDGGDGGD